MNDIDKLKHLLPHWREHNADHSRSYADWAARARRAGLGEVADLLDAIARASDELDGLFQKTAVCLENI